MITDNQPDSRPPALAIIQARMSSSRLPGKVLKDIAGEPMLVRVVERTRRATTIGRIAVATTTDPSDDLLAEFCTARGYPFYRGSLYDVLDRYYQTALGFAGAKQRASSPTPSDSPVTPAPAIVRITADCPLIDPQVIDRTINAFYGRIAATDRVLFPSGPSAEVNATPVAGPTASPAATSSFDFAANRLPPPWGRTYPIGLDVEVCTFEGLETCWKEARAPHQREHVMPYFYDHAGRFRVLLVNHHQDFGSLRWTVDTPADLELVRRIFASFPGRDDFSWLEVLDLFQRQPELAEINAGVKHKHYQETDHRRS